MPPKRMSRAGTGSRAARQHVWTQLEISCCTATFWTQLERSWLRCNVVLQHATNAQSAAHAHVHFLHVNMLSRTTARCCPMVSVPGSTAASGKLGTEPGNAVKPAADVCPAVPTAFFFFWPALPVPAVCGPANRDGCGGVSMGAGSGARCGGSCSAATDACRCSSEPGTRPACKQHGRGVETTQPGVPTVDHD